MNHQAELRLQAWLDGELPAGEAQAVAAWVERDAVAGALARELGATKAALLGNELPRPLPESPEFYWSKIERELARAEAAAPPRGRSGWRAGWARFLAPAGIVAALAVLLIGPLQPSRRGVGLVSTTEVDSPLDDISSITFRSESEGMTVVWVNIQ